MEHGTCMAVPEAAMHKKDSVEAGKNKVRTTR
jgi:hypothetical protein